MIDEVLKIIAPYRCYGCAKLGKSLCNGCKYYITDEPFMNCVSCMNPANGLCTNCNKSYEKVWCVGELDGFLKELIYDYKFKHSKEIAKDLADALVSRIGLLPKNIIVTNIPTLARHIRRRGYDHTKLIAQKLARVYGLKYQDTLSRISKTQQLGSSATKRWSQAKNAFEPKLVIEGAIYLLIDDIVTTGATIEHASKSLKKAGASQVWVGVIARQTID